MDDHPFQTTKNLHFPKVDVLPKLFFKSSMLLNSYSAAFDSVSPTNSSDDLCLPFCLIFIPRCTSTLYSAHCTHKNGCKTKRGSLNMLRNVNFKMYAVYSIHHKNKYCSFKLFLLASISVFASESTRLRGSNPFFINLLTFLTDGWVLLARIEPRTISYATVQYINNIAYFCTVCIIVI